VTPLALEATRLDAAELVGRPARGAECARSGALLAAHHYLGFQNTVGEALGYLATLND
jgi:hypothetical protein